MTAEHPVIAGIRWIIKNRTHVVDGKVKKFNPTSLALAAGLNRGHLEQMLSGRHKGDIKRATALKIARAGDVRVEWLFTGVGPIEPFQEPEEGAPLRVRETALGRGRAGEPTEEDDPCVPRAQYFDIARQRGADESVLTALRRAPVPKGAEGDPTTVEYWHAEYMKLKRAADAFAPELRSVDDGLDE